MNYEEAFRHYREGTATEEEKAFGQEEIAKAKALSSLMDDQGLAVKPAPIKEADAKEVKDAKQHLVWKRVLAGLLAVIVLLVALGAILGGVFGSAAAYANDNIAVSRAEARDIAAEFAMEDAARRGYTVEGNGYYVESEREIDERCNFEGDLKSSYYSYKGDVTCYTTDGYELEYEIEVNSHTGSAWVYEFDLDREDRR